MEKLPHNSPEPEIRYDYDPKQLVEELRGTKFDQAYATEFGEAVDLYSMHTRSIPRTNEFIRIFGIYAGFRLGKKPENPVEQALLDTATDRQYEDIFAGFEAQCPNLYAKMGKLYLQQKAAEQAAREAAERPETPYEEKQRRAEQEYYSAYAYTKMAEIATSQIDPKYNLGYLYKFTPN